MTLASSSNTRESSIGTEPYSAQRQYRRRPLCACWLKPGIEILFLRHVIKVVKLSQYNSKRGRALRPLRADHRGNRHRPIIVRVLSAPGRSLSATLRLRVSRLFAPPPDWVIVDYQTTPMNRTDVVRMAGRSQDSPNGYVPIIHLAARGKPNSVKKARAAGVSETLTRPRTAKDLLPRISAILCKPGPSSTDRPIFELAGRASGISPRRCRAAQPSGSAGPAAQAGRKRRA
jgi:CheY-like chemotaxis protein